MTTGHRSNIYLQASAIADLEALFLHLQAAGDIPANEKLENIGNHRSKLITYALKIAVEQMTLEQNKAKA